MTKTGKSNKQQNTHLEDSDDEMLRVLQQRTFKYFLEEMNDQTGLIADKTKPGSRIKYCGNWYRVELLYCRD
jgi:hypothetical protein